MTQLPRFKDPMIVSSRRPMTVRSFGSTAAWVSLIVLSEATWGVARGQDPFDDLGSIPSQTAPAASSGSESLLDTSETNAVVRSLKANPPKSPAELAQAIKLMTRIGRWDQAGFWLDRLGNQPIDGPTAIEVLRGAGPKTWADILANPDSFKPEHLDTIAKLRQLADDEVHSPENLARQVSRLT